MDDTKNWYLRLTEKFFFDKEVIEIENISQARNGMFFPSFVIHLYLKMLCYSIRENGLIMIQSEYCDNDNVSYMIARMFGFENQQPYVEQALRILLKQKLIEIFEDTNRNTTNIFMEKLPDYTGSVKLSSIKRQRRRLAAKESQMLQLESDATKNKSKETKEKYSYRQNVLLTKGEYAELSVMDNFSSVLELYSRDKYIRANEKKEVTSDDYANLKSMLKAEKN